MQEDLFVPTRLTLSLKLVRSLADKEIDAVRDTCA